MSLGTTSISELPVANQQGPPVNLALQESNSNESINTSAQQLTQQREMDDNKVAQQNQPPPNPQDFMKREKPWKRQTNRAIKTTRKRHSA